MSAILDTIKAEMAVRKITQRELAKAVGVTAATLNFKLNGRSEFSVSELISVSEALGTDYYSLIELAAEREARDKKGQK
ncbi:helix-turn-helix domain-containing protein [Alloscardovia omnicolens]|uniref:helix-turn-helix domain-containing protein n=1 Tax=Alloscardovia omnicolens TaxID=419015 RepID=UPI00254F971E|nr:helix-turn-helix transcriptional regulator [Alloscardovia omnicolens]MDK6522703.1 helix-turn-helix transcriptional regulator [Alloscardovia omnicolens]